MLAVTKPTSIKDIKRSYHLFDAKGKILGRLATEIAEILIGKNKPYYSPNMDCGDWVVVVNAREIRLSGKKEEQKVYYRHSGYPGGLRAVGLAQMREEHPERILEHAVLGMLPKNKLRDPRMRRLKVFPGQEHSYPTQKLINHS